MRILPVSNSAQDSCATQDGDEQAAALTKQHGMERADAVKTTRPESLCPEHQCSEKLRPERLRIQDELGRARTLDEQALVRLLPGNTKRPALVLGLGPCPGATVRQMAATFPMGAHWLECPDFSRCLPETAYANLPETWKRVAPNAICSDSVSANVDACVDVNGDACGAEHTGAHSGDDSSGPFLAAFSGDFSGTFSDDFLGVDQCEVWAYVPGLRFFSAFWGPLLGRLRLNRLRNEPHMKGSHTALLRRVGVEANSRVVLLPGDEHGLLTMELEEAFQAEGYSPVRLPVGEPAASQAVAHFLSNERPTLFFSVNLRGLDPEGATFHLLQAAGIPVGIWFVDNPWHVLSALRQPWWMQARLFVTDASFIQPLRKHGVKDVAHLPLAAWYTPSGDGRVLQARSVQVADSMPPLVFVGRSAFPDKARFFAGRRVPPEVAECAKSAPCPNFTWWCEALGLGCLWPGNDVRSAGLGAEECSLDRRTSWLGAAAVHGLAVYGDEAWKSLLPPAVQVRRPVDYYAALPGIYAAAPYSLNVTSLLLPAGLTQRHFDVWMAGGFLLSDATPGLRLFPDELTRPIALDGPAALSNVLDRFEKDPALKGELAAAWRDCICRGHTCRHRIRFICEHLAL